MSYVTFLLHCIHKIFIMFNYFSEAVKTVNKTKREPECSREWSPCSVTCGYGLSHRYGSETCDVIKDTRVCYPTPCNTSTIEWVCISYDINSVKQIVNNCRYYVFVFTWYFFSLLSVSEQKEVQAYFSDNKERIHCSEFWEPNLPQCPEVQVKILQHVCTKSMLLPMEDQYAHARVFVQ